MSDLSHEASVIHKLNTMTENDAHKAEHLRIDLLPEIKPPIPVEQFPTFLSKCGFKTKTHNYDIYHTYMQLKTTRSINFNDMLSFFDDLGNDIVHFIPIQCEKGKINPLPNWTDMITLFERLTQSTDYHAKHEYSARAVFSCFPQYNPKYRYHNIDMASHNTIQKILDFMPSDVDKYWMLANVVDFMPPITTQQQYEQYLTKFRSEASGKWKSDANHILFGKLGQNVTPIAVEAPAEEVPTKAVDDKKEKPKPTTRKRKTNTVTQVISAGWGSSVMAVDHASGSVTMIQGCGDVKGFCDWLCCRKKKNRTGIYLT